MTGDALKAALYLEAVLPALAVLAARDTALKNAAAGPRPFALTLAVRGQSPRRLAFATDGTVTTSTTPQPGDLRLWFPSAGQFLRIAANRPALTLPVGGWSQLTQLRRFSSAGARLETLLNTRADAHLVLHAWGSLVVALAASAAWLRHHPDGPATRAHLGNGTAVFECLALPAPLWLDLATLTTGAGEPASPVTARITFADLATVLAELDQQLDAPAALGLGTLRITGRLPLAENLGLLMLKIGSLLKPSSQISALSSQLG
jgi:hypothetical protein